MVREVCLQKRGSRGDSANCSFADRRGRRSLRWLGDIRSRGFGARRLFSGGRISFREMLYPSPTAVGGQT